MATITISRLLGSEGAAIAERVAEHLSYALVTKQTLEKILEQYGLVHLDSFYKAPPRLWSRLDYDTKHLVSMLNRIMLLIAKRGEAVILGRGGYASLKNLSVLDLWNTNVTDAGMDTIAQLEAGAARQLQVGLVDETSGVERLASPGATVELPSGEPARLSATPAVGKCVSRAVKLTGWVPRKASWVLKLISTSPIS